VAETLKVDPGELVKLAARLATEVGQAQGMELADTVYFAGADDISRAGALRLTRQGAQLANLINMGRYVVLAAAYEIGAAGKRYSETDAAGRNRIASAKSGANSASTSGVVTNPVVPPTPSPPRPVPAVSTDVPAGDIDPKFFAHRLQLGDGGSSASTFAASWRAYLGAAHRQTAEAVVRTANGARRWEPVGSTEVAPSLTRFKTWHDQVGDYAAKLSQRADDYSHAFRKAKAAHPSLQTIEAADLRLQRAIASRIPQEIAAARKHRDRVYRQSYQAQQEYRTAIESGVRDEDVNSRIERPRDIATQTSAAVDNENGPPRGGNGTGTGSGGNGTGTGSGGNQTRKGSVLKDVLNGVLTGANGIASVAPLLAQLLGSGGDGTLPDVPPIELPPPPPPPLPPPPPIQDPARSNTIPQIPDPSQLANADPNSGADDSLREDPYLEDPLLDEPYLDDYGGYGGGPGGGGLGGGGGGGLSDSAVAGIPLSRTANAGAPFRAAARPSGAPVAGGRSQPGAGGMPYMPFMPGMGGANANAGDRKNPFAVDQKIVDDDELRSRVLASATVNEKPPVLPPEATRPTPDKTATNQAGVPT
jgi:hypothetical protein